MVSCGARVADFISMTEPYKLVEKAIGMPNATWNSVKNEMFPSLCSYLASSCFNASRSIIKVGSQYDVKSCVLHCVAMQTRMQGEVFGLSLHCVALQHVYNRTVLCNTTQRKDLRHIVNQPLGN